jgi:hypothetical protein
VRPIYALLGSQQLIDGGVEVFPGLNLSLFCQNRPDLRPAVDDDKSAIALCVVVTVCEEASVGEEEPILGRRLVLQNGPDEGMRGVEGILLVVVG